MNIKKALPIVFGILLAASPFSAKAISENTAKAGAAVASLAIGGGAGALSYFYLLPNNLNQPSKIALSVAIGACSGAISWYTAYAIFHSMTPQGKLASAQNLIQLVDSDSLIARNYDSLHDFISHVSIRFGTSWPLVLTRNHLIHSSNHLLEAQSLLNSAYQEAYQDSSLTNLCTEIKKLQDKLPRLAKTLEDTISAVTQTHDYLEQVKLYERHLEEERKRQHQSWEKNMDRWHESYEKSKDRKLKEQALQRAGNARINVTI